MIRSHNLVDDASTVTKEIPTVTPLTHRIARRASSALNSFAVRRGDSVMPGAAMASAAGGLSRSESRDLIPPRATATTPSFTSDTRPRTWPRAVRAATSLLAVSAGAFLLAAPVAAMPSPKPFKVEKFHIVPSTTQAAAHEDLTTEFDFAHNLKSQTQNDVRTVIVNLPPGFIGSNTAVPTCPYVRLPLSPGKDGCPASSAVGQISFDFGGEEFERDTTPIYNMEVTTPGIAAVLGFHVLHAISVMPITVRPGDAGLTITSPDIQNLGEIHAVSVTVWGLPASHAHDRERQLLCESGKCEDTRGGSLPAGIAEKPFLSNPTGCEPHVATMEADSWEHPEEWSRAETEISPIIECERVPFQPEIKAAPTTNSAESPTGLDFSLLVPQAWDNPVSLSTANLDDATVTLPAGMSLNPSAGSGLGVCTEAQLAEMTYDSPPGVGCPAESKIGSVEVETPVLFEKATAEHSAVYVAKPFDNPFHSLLALYVVARIPERGVIVKVAGKVTPDPLTGQLTTTFLNNPQVPFNRFTLSFRQGATSPLISPPVCGRYAAEADLTPWSAPTSPQHLISEFEIEHGIGGGPCPSGGTPPFHPGLVAGTLNNRAGAYSPFYVRLSRNDGEQEITHFSIKLPPGITGKLAGIPYCPDAAIAQAKSRSHPGEAAIEEANPSCPAASEVGHTLVEAGVGSVLAQAPGKVYLAGPYHGAPISVVSITDAHVGPFDLGTVVVQLGFKINPETAEVFVDSVGSDPIPHIIDGIPTHLRQIRVYMDKPQFVLNPTGCEPTSTASTVLGSGTNFASEADDQPVTVSSPFQAADCAALGFKPKLKLSLIGGTKRAGNPAFKAVLTANPGDANIGSAQVTLPHSEFLDNAHIKTICTRVVFAEGAVPGEKCPADSVYGFAKAVTPILSEPLEGPVYLRSSSHQLPDLVAALHNSQVNIALDGHVEGVKGGIRNTFEAVPDAPVTKFTLEMQGGNKGLLENSTNLCARPHRATADFVGHNGKVDDFRPLLAVSCGKKGKRGGGVRHNRAAR